MHTAEASLPAPPTLVPVASLLAGALGVPTFLLGLGLGVTLPLMIAGLLLGSAGLFLARVDTPAWQVRLSLLGVALAALTPIVSVLALLTRGA